MAGVLELNTEAFKKSLNPRLWLFLLAIELIGIAAFFAIIFVLLIPAVLVFYVFNLQLVSFVLWAILALAGIILFIYVGAIMSGTMLFLVKDFFETKKILLNEAFNKALARAPALFGVQIILSLLFFAILAVLLLPVLLSIAALIPNLQPQMLLSNPQAIIAPLFSVLLIGVLMFFVFVLVAVLISPFALLLVPVAVFENLSSFGAIKKAFALAKQDYLKKILSVILFSFIVGAISLSFWPLTMLLSFLSMIASFVPNLSVALSLFLLAVRIGMNIVLMVWIVCFQNIFLADYYKNALAFVETPAKPVQSSTIPFEKPPSFEARTEPIRFGSLKKRI